MKRCARCQATILSSELVMRARDLVFHVHCFSCEVCNSPLTKGDHFGLRGCSVLCRLHFEMPPDGPPTGMFPMHGFPGKSDGKSGRFALVDQFTISSGRFQCICHPFQVPNFTRRCRPKYRRLQWNRRRGNRPFSMVKRGRRPDKKDGPERENPRIWKA